MKKIFFIITLLNLFASSTFADEKFVGNILLGSTHLSEMTDRDVLQLPPCRYSQNRSISHIKLRVSKFPAQLDFLKITFQNDETQVLPVKKHFAPEETSRWIDLKRGLRCIKKIVVVGDTDTYRYRPNSQAKVTFWGLTR